MTLIDTDLPGKLLPRLATRRRFAVLFGLLTIHEGVCFSSDAARRRPLRAVRPLVQLLAGFACSGRPRALAAGPPGRRAHVRHRCGYRWCSRLSVPRQMAALRDPDGGGHERVTLVWFAPPSGLPAIGWNRPGWGRGGRVSSGCRRPAARAASGWRSLIAIALGPALHDALAGFAPVRGCAVPEALRALRLPACRRRLSRHQDAAAREAARSDGSRRFHHELHLQPPGAARGGIRQRSRRRRGARDGAAAVAHAAAPSPGAGRPEPTSALPDPASPSSCPPPE